jgi:hypothetical protein
MKYNKILHIIHPIEDFPELDIIVQLTTIQDNFQEIFSSN